MNNKLETISNLFEDKEIRSIWDDKKKDYYFSVVDVISVLTESKDPSHYWRTLKSRMIQEGNETVTNCDTLKLKAKDGKMRYTDMLDTKNMFRLIESIPSPKARFGRDYGWNKIYLGETFPEHNIRFISINDNLDSLKNENYTDSLEFALLSITYEHYAIDISKKVSAVKHIQQSRGEFIGVSAPYGYLKDPTDNHKFAIDDYVTNIVKRIFNMTLEGKSKKEIADILNKENILTPSQYKSKITKVTSEKTIQASSWNNHIINEILKNETYIGTLIQ